MAFSAAAICLVVCHPGSAEHFAAFAKELGEERIEVHASKAVQGKFAKSIPFESPNGLSEEEKARLAVEVAQKCKTASVVLTDVGDSFSEHLLRELKEVAPEIRRYAYYDNPEAYVRDYSETAAKVMEVAQKVLFANATHVKSQEIKLSHEKRIGIGYYPAAKAETIAKRREEERPAIRAQLFAACGLEEKGQQLAIYFGGCNERYFYVAFPTFLQFLGEAVAQGIDLSHVVVALQQHPRAKETNRDKELLEAWVQQYGPSPHAPKLILSPLDSDSIQVAADYALYDQTSMAPNFALAGIPVMQVAPERPDLLVRSGFPCATSAKALVQTLSEKQAGQREAVYEGLGMREDWLERMKRALFEPAG